MNEEQLQAMTNRKNTIILDEKEINEWSGRYADLATVEEPAERDRLPWFKDPSLKAGLWAILKDNIGKDLSKIALPVTFNEPISLTQKCVQGLEYACILNSAATRNEDIGFRCACVAMYGLATYASIERNNQKPFNPILGETFEYTDGDIECLTE